MNNATLLTADRTTHAKIVAVALIASIGVSLIGIAVRAKPVGSEPLIQASPHTVMAGTGYTANPNHINRIEQNRLEASWKTAEIKRVR